MLINFLDSLFAPQLCCDKISDDHYDLSNLVSSNKSKKDLGWQAYSISKPPATISIQLSCKIEIHSIRIWTTIGSLRSTKLEIYSKGCNDRFYKIGEATAEIEAGINFCNQSPPIGATENLKYSQFFRSATHMIKNVNELKVCIKETLKSPPVIKKFEIWGKSAKSNSQEETMKIAELWNQHINPPQIYDETSIQPKPIEEINSDLIDEAFLDCITYEIMLLPMVLPSGKTVDQSTILKHNLYEERLGRSPSDPFTFQIYTSTRKPILNAALKGRIDTFLLQHSSNPELRGVGRTLGKRLLTENTEGSPNKEDYGIESCGKRFKLLPSTSSTITEPLSLDLMVSNALKNITRFSQPKKVELENVCFSCNSNDINSLYKILKCTHLICRACLLGNKLFCVPCNMSFNNKEVEKFHN